jgi:D-alanine-D-alanine ligase
MSSKPIKPLRILLLVQESLVPPASIEGLSDKEIAPYKTEFDVWTTLMNLGHKVKVLGIGGDLAPIKAAIDDFKPHVAFNLLEEFDGVGVWDAHVVSYLELCRQPYTGCNPRGLMIAHDKALTKMILRHHRIRVPNFHVFPMGLRVKRPPRLGLPLLVKSLTEEGSVGIAQASVVYDDDKLTERVKFVHETLGTHAIAEQYIDGREIYVGVMGNYRLETLPPWELHFTKLREDAPKIATGKTKWDYEYQKKIGLESRKAENLPEPLNTELPHICKRIYRTLGLSGYARLDFRLTENGRVYLIEANPNPQIAFGEDFAESAHAVGIEYPQLLQRLVTIGLGYKLRGMG